MLTVLRELQAERGGRAVSTLELYGRVVERVALSEAQLQAVLSRLAGRAVADRPPRPTRG